MKRQDIALLMSFNGGFVDTAGFLGLQGLFTAHVTGNFVTLGAALVFGTHGVIAKVLALPEFIIVVGLTRLIGSSLTAGNLPAPRILALVEVSLLAAFCVLAVAFGPFPDSDAPAALLTGLAAIAAMAIQNATQRIHFANLPPSTIMTGNTTQAALDMVDLLRGMDSTQAPAVRVRFSRTIRGILIFAAGCGAAASLYAWFGFWCLILPVVVGASTAIISAED
jgi:uncharacterized membrane protein YoaK (UPF0700 family)